jgi:hypothetical protein
MIEPEVTAISALSSDESNSLCSFRSNFCESRKYAELMVSKSASKCRVTAAHIITRTKVFRFRRFHLRTLTPPSPNGSATRSHSKPLVPPPPLALQRRTELPIAFHFSTQEFITILRFPSHPLGFPVLVLFVKGAQWGPFEKGYRFQFSTGTWFRHQNLCRSIWSVSPFPLSRFDIAIVTSPPCRSETASSL